MMKKTILLFALAISIISCNKTTETKEFKTAYIDTSKLMEESTEAKDIGEKYKDKSKVMGSQIEVEATRLEAEKKNFDANARKNGQVWAQQKYGEIQQRTQELTYAQQAMLRQLQDESSVEMDTLVSSYRKLIREYGKEKGFDYVYGSGDTSPSILYAKDSYDITKEIIKLINDKYKSSDKKEEKPDAKTEAKK